MKRNELRQIYPAHRGDWRAASITRIQPKTKPMNSWRVLGGLAALGIIILAAISCVMAALSGLGLFHA